MPEITATPTATAAQVSTPTATSTPTLPHPPARTAINEVIDTLELQESLARDISERISYAEFRALFYRDNPTVLDLAWMNLDFGMRVGDSVVDDWFAYKNHHDRLYSKLKSSQCCAEVEGDIRVNTVCLENALLETISAEAMFNRTAFLNNDIDFETYRGITGAWGRVARCSHDLADVWEEARDRYRL